MKIISIKEIENRLLRIQELSTLPDTILRILSVTENPASTAADLANEIAKDPALTAKVLSTVNSSFYGFYRRIMSVFDAVVLLGFTEVERIALAISVINVLGGKKEWAKQLAQLWRHSLATSIAVEVISEVQISQSGTIYTGVRAAALLHDIGKAVLMQYFAEIYTEVIKIMKKTGLSTFDAEKQVMNGIDHCEVGARLGEKWKLPEPIIQVIRYHDSPCNTYEHHNLIYNVHLANLLCYRLNIPDLILEGTSQTTKTESQSEKNIISLVDRVQERLARHKEIINLITAYAI